MLLMVKALRHRTFTQAIPGNQRKMSQSISQQSPRSVGKVILL